jgi:hypothetical protein
MHQENLNNLPQNKNQTHLNDYAITTPIQPIILKAFLAGYDKQSTEFLIKGFYQGFKIPYTGKECQIISSNHKSVRENVTILQQKIEKEITAGRVEGPFQKPPSDNFRVSPLGLIPKKTSGEFRVIHDLSHPTGNSVNEGIPEMHRTVSYQSIDDAVRIVIQLGKKCLLSKVDIEHALAYKIIPINPTSFHLLGFVIGDKYFFDKTLPMGLSYSCNLFEQFSCAIHWIAETKLGILGCVHVIDDFLFISPPDYKQASENLYKFLKFADKLGLPIKDEKTVVPTTQLTFLGLELDTDKMEIRLPVDKLQKLQTLLKSFLKLKKVTLQELQSLIGLLNFTCMVVVPARAFLRRIIDLTKGIQKPHHKRRLTKSAKADLLAWSIFVESFNGKSVLQQHVFACSNSLHMYTDASNIGFGGFIGTQWFVSAWPKSWLELHISVRELYPIVLALELWAKEIQNKHIEFHCDNLAVVYSTNKQTEKDPHLMKLICRLVIQALHFNIFFSTRHIPGLRNVIADKLSRLQMDEFRRVAPYMDKEPTVVSHLVSNP